MSTISHPSSLPEMSEWEAWASPSAKSEARRCLELSNGGIAKMRETISISSGERAELLACCVEEPKLSAQILKSIEFRSQVLREFDRLVGTRASENAAENQNRLRPS